MEDYFYFLKQYFERNHGPKSAPLSLPPPLSEAGTQQHQCAARQHSRLQQGI
jgi:hypothetical protein